MLNGQSKQQVWVPSTPPESESDEEMMSMQEALIMDCAERCAASKSSLRAVRGTPSQWGWTRRNARRTRVPGLRGGGDDALEREERRIDREKRQVEKEEEDRNAPTLTSEDVIHGEVAPPLSPTGTVASTSSWFPGFTRVTPIPPFDTTTQVRSAHLPNAPSTSPPTTRPDPINRRPSEHRSLDRVRTGDRTAGQGTSRSRSPTPQLPRNPSRSRFEFEFDAEDEQAYIVERRDRGNRE
jgi:hypothetical protein